MKSIFKSSVILLTIFGLTSCSSESDKLGQAGIDLFHKGDISGAYTKFEELIKRDSNNAEAHFWKADCLAELNDLKGSINSYTTALNINPKYKIAFYNRALTYEKLNDFEKAIVDYHSAIDVDPQNKSELNNKRVFHNLGILYGQLGQLDNAIIAFTKAIEIDGSYSDAYHNRGFAHQLKYEHDKAIEDFDRALKLSPDNRDYINSKTRSLNAKDGTTRALTLP